MTENYVITIIAGTARQKLDEVDFAAVHEASHAQGFRTGAPHWLSLHTACDIPLMGEASDDRAWVRALADELDQVDVIFQPDNAYRRKKLLISDMDSTIIQQECIDELAAEMGIKPQISAITERAMSGELDFEAALVERVALLKGLDEGALERVYQNRIDFMPGAKELVATMRHHGAHCLLVSGGFTYFTSKVCAALGFHGESANVLELADGKLTGTVQMPVLGKEAKLDALNAACKALDIPRAASLGLGDGANDLPMLQASGLGVAYHAKPAVRAATHAGINHGDLRSVLYAQGYADEEIFEV